jgi:hypothetical protein
MDMALAMLLLSPAKMPLAISSTLVKAQAHLTISFFFAGSS